MANYIKYAGKSTVLVTGAAGFIGFHLSKRILELGGTVIGFDNLNDYYDVSLKEARLEILKKYDKFTFIKGDLKNSNAQNSHHRQIPPSALKGIHH